ncbi:hypothetical protein HHL21_14430 [Massilia sp. RP-1-19]|uniref:Uncharacterized protein n=1 Tax=Massilia polaris TaxID=2728846 RepID=A0A848HQ34_9BURK|nr:hypothetical protein [Massilia polaris]NML62250.1 hypothetical protein [Massilia polaris]
MENFERWKAAYIAMDERRKWENLIIAEGAAADHPAETKPPLLLVANSGGAHDAGHSLSRTHDRSTPILVRAVSKS